MRKLSFLLMTFFLIAAVEAQQTQPEGIFPLTTLLLELDHAGTWRPDWPFELPPDAFKVLFGKLSRASIETENLSLNLAFVAGSIPEEFPFMLSGMMAQVSLVYGESNEVRELNIAFSTETEPWNLEFLEYRDSFPYLIRVYGANTWYFIYFSQGASEIVESWYDETGNFLRAFSFSFIDIGGLKRITSIRDYADASGGAEFFYDSRSLPTESLGNAGNFRVLYFREDLPRYWERMPVGADAGKFYLQWDERGLLLRVTGEGEAYFDARYEYSFDDWGNWVERRETRMARNSGLLVPVQGATIKRILEYAE